MLVAIVATIAASGWLSVEADADPAQLVANGGFEGGQSPWKVAGPNLITSRPHTGTRSLDVCNYVRCQDEAWQILRLPTPASILTVSYWSYVTTRELPGAPCSDSLTVQVRTATGVPITTADKICNGDASGTWVQRSVDLTAALAPQAGAKVQLFFLGQGNSTLSTDFVLDDVALTVGAPAAPPSTTAPTTAPTTATTTPTTATTTPTTTAPPTVWRPAVGASWQLQLQGTVDTSVGAGVFDIDGHDTPASTVDRLHQQGKQAVCYLSGGSWEDWRPDASQFPASVLGNSNGWPGERWLDVRAIALLRPVMQNRIAQQCTSKNFDAVDWDNLDGYTNNSGFPLTYQDQLAYNRMLADLAHGAGLSVGLKNDLEQVNDLVGDFDFAVNEQCKEYNECELLAPFIAAGKPVFHVEYSLSVSQFCPSDQLMRFSGIKKSLSLLAAVTPCQPY